MELQKIEARTFYTVEIAFSEWWEIFRRHDDETMENAMVRFRRFPVTANAQDLNKLANKIGFHGFQNAGYINSDGRYVAVFYRQGCRI